MTRHERLATLARKMMLTDAQAVALPETITVAARKMGRSESWMIEQAMGSAAVSAYLASVCRSVTK